MPRIQISVSEIDFQRDEQANANLCIVKADIKIGRPVATCEFGAQWLEDGRWALRRWPRFREEFARQLDNDAQQKVAQMVANLLLIFNLFSSVPNNGAVRVNLRIGRVPLDERDRVWLSHRPQVAKLTGPGWGGLWARIMRRIDYDDAFFVAGFSKSEIAIAATHLAQVFPDDWVRARYRAAGLDGINSDLNPENEAYFPAYHIARAASGALCTEPGWKYLIEIGLALEKLKDFDGYKRLKGGVTTSTGTQHHLCVAANLYERGLLVGLEPETGHGAARNDLLVEASGCRYQIELKEFSSATPIKSLKREIARKSERVPERPEVPVVFHVVLHESANVVPEREREFCKSIEEALNEIPANISAIIVGRRFLDSSGGRTKRDVIGTYLNPNAVNVADMDILSEMFRANYEQISFPLFGFKAPAHFSGASRDENPN